MTTAKRSGAGTPIGVRRCGKARINGVEYIVDMQYRRICEVRNPDGVFSFDQDESIDGNEVMD